MNQEYFQRSVKTDSILFLVLTLFGFVFYIISQDTGIFLPLFGLFFISTVITYFILSSENYQGKIYERKYGSQKDRFLFYHQVKSELAEFLITCGVSMLDELKQKNLHDYDLALDMEKQVVGYESKLTKHHEQEMLEMVRNEYNELLSKHGDVELQELTLISNQDYERAIFLKKVIDSIVIDEKK